MQVSINDELMVGSKYNSCGLLWYGCDYIGTILPEGVDEKKWTKNEIIELLKKYPVKENYIVQYTEKDNKHYIYNITYKNNNFDVKKKQIIYEKT